MSVRKIQQEVQEVITMPVSSQNELLTVEEAARYLKASTVWTVRNLLSKGRIKFIKIGKRHNVRKAELDRYIQENEQQEQRIA